MNTWSLDGYAQLGGGSIGSIPQTFTVEGRTVTIDRPLIPVGDGLAVGPKLELDGRSIRVRLDQWAAICFHAAVPVLPLTVPTPEAAIEVHKAFASTPGIDWNSSAADIELWAANFVGRR
ncbi:hypothetical protein [Amycolatopsis sp. NPDC004079]|uniref:hypothetical protein n=1 Tax=Amycolatopsis sp. NPDC004079 TaxID=3154549 RepID=UPI0033BC819D